MEPDAGWDGEWDVKCDVELEVAAPRRRSAAGKPAELNAVWPVEIPRETSAAESASAHAATSRE